MSGGHSLTRIVAVTGGTGFVGRRLVKRHLGMGDRVRVLSRKRSEDSRLPSGTEVFCGDLTGDVNALEGFVDGADVLYHCAAELYAEKDMMHVNAEGTRNLAVAAACRIKRWVQLSSVAVYGRQPPGIVTESTPTGTCDNYPTTLSKLEAERIVAEYAVSGGYEYSILRPCKIYGAGMRDDSLRRMADYVKRRLFFFIGKPGASANYVHVDNVVEALILCAADPAARNRAFNLCDGFTLEQLLNAIANEIGCPVPGRRLPQKLVDILSAAARLLLPGFPLTPERIAGLTSRTVYSAEAIRALLGYTPVMSLEQGMAELLGSAQLERPYKECLVSGDENR